MKWSNAKDLYIYTKFYQGISTKSYPVVDYTHVRGWSFPCGLSRCPKPILYHKKALTVHFFSYFSYDMSYCFLIAALY